MTPIDQLKSVLCDPAGKCSITGSDEDRAIIERALQALAAPVQKRPQNCGTGYCSCVECVMEPAPVQTDAWPCLIAEADFEQNTVTLEMQCSDYKVGAGQHWLHTTPPAAQRQYRLLEAIQVASQILTYLGFSQDESIQPGADRRRDTVAAMIEQNYTMDTTPPVKALGIA